MPSAIRVLHVDDDRGFRELTRRSLERAGFEVETARSADEAIAMLDGSIDCIVSDYQMPDADGLDLLARLEETDHTQPFILFTGQGSEEIASEAIRAGVTDYLQKQPSGDQFTLLANRIEHAVDQQRTAAALTESERMLSTLVSNLPGVVYRCENEPDWPFEYIDGSVADLTGYEPAAFLDGRVSWSDLVHPRDNEAAWETVQAAVADHDPFEVTYRITSKGGDERWCWEQGRGVYADGTLVALEGFITDITDRMDRQRELARYERLLNEIGDAVYTTNAIGEFTMINDAAVELTGYTRQEGVGEHVSLLLGSDEIERGEALIRELLRNDEATATYEHTLTTADGETVTVENHISVLTDADGRFTGTVGVLRRSDDGDHARLRRLHEATRTLLETTDPQTIAEETTVASKDVLGQPLAVVWFYDDATGQLEPVAESVEILDQGGPRPVYDVGDGPVGRVYQTGESKVVPDVTTLADDRDRGEVESALYFPLGDHGVFAIGATTEDAFDESDIQLVSILAANVTVALDRARQEQALRTERDNFAALFENVPDPTISVVFEGDEPRVTAVNSAFEEVFGLEEETVVGSVIDDYIVPPEDRSNAAAYNERIRRGESFHGEVRRQAADGLRDFLLHVVPHRVGRETTQGYAIYTDITEQKQRERELERQNERLEEFASVVSHDLRNPLSVAAGRLELARETGAAEHFDAVERAHNRMEELIESLRRLARADTQSTDPVVVELADIARAAWATVSTGSATLTVADSLAVTADPDRLQQLFENLFRNAIEHAGGQPTVTIGALVDDRGFYVADDGPGIPAGDRDRVFESGYSGADGTGVGLAIVRDIADTHGWRTHVAESEAGGARFEFVVDNTPQTDRSFDTDSR